MPERYAIVGSGGSRLDDAGFRERARGAVEEFSRHRLDEGRWQAFAQGLSYVSAPLDDPAAFGPLRERLVALDAELGAEGRRLFYCGTPPSAFPTIVRRIGEARSRGERARGSCSRSRSGTTWQARSSSAASCARSSTSRGCSASTITSARRRCRTSWSSGSPTRWSSGPGAARRSTTSRSRSPSPPASSGAAATTRRPARCATWSRTTCSRCSRSWRWSRPTRSPRRTFATARRRCSRPCARSPRTSSSGGSTRPAWSRDTRCPGTATRNGSRRSRRVETFVALRAWIDNARWKDVPFFLRTGKRLPHRATEVAIVLRESERRLFEDAGIARLPAHHLALRIQPDEGISLVFRAKEPGPGMALDAVPMDFSYGGSFRTRSAEAYERLLHDAMAGDQTLFLREDAVERSWEIVAPILDASGTVHPYAAGTWGPERRRRADRPARVALGLSRLRRSDLVVPRTLDGDRSASRELGPRPESTPVPRPAAALARLRASRDSISDDRDGRGAGARRRTSGDRAAPASVEAAVAPPLSPSMQLDTPSACRRRTSALLLSPERGGATPVPCRPFVAPPLITASGSNLRAGPVCKRVSRGRSGHDRVVRAGALRARP